MFNQSHFLNVMKTKSTVLAATLFFAFFACQKNDVTDTSAGLTDLQLKSASIALSDVAVESVSEEASYEAYFYSEYEHMLRHLVRVKGRKGNLLSGRGYFHYEAGMAPVVSIDTADAGYPITITIEYGDSTVTRHGRVISGQVVIEISGAKDTDGSTRKVSFIDCAVDSIGIDGTLSETFNGDNSSTRVLTTTSDVTFTLADGTTITRVGSDVREWLQGLDTTGDRSDDRIQITGILNVTSSTGDTYTREITDPLIRLGDCFHPVQGLVQYSQNSTVLATLDYGTGECDNLASLTTDGTTVEIELRDRKMPLARVDGRQICDQKGRMHGN